MGILEKCPICGSKLEKGYIRGGGTLYGIVWKRGEYSRRHYDIILDKSWSGPRVLGYECRKCKLILIPYGEAKEENEKVNFTA